MTTNHLQARWAVLLPILTAATLGCVNEPDVALVECATTTVGTIAANDSATLGFSAEDVIAAQPTGVDTTLQLGYDSTSPPDALAGALRLEGARSYAIVGDVRHVSFAKECGIQGDALEFDVTMQFEGTLDGLPLSSSATLTTLAQSATATGRKHHQPQAMGATRGDAELIAAIVKMGETMLQTTVDDLQGRGCTVSPVWFAPAYGNTGGDEFGLLTGDCANASYVTVLEPLR